MKPIKTLLSIVLIELIIAIPMLTWGALHHNGNKISAEGQFYGSHEATDQNGDTDIYYHFKANDGSVWWDLTEAQMGFIPKANAEYVLIYDNNGTTGCECTVYDDTFISIKGK